MEKRNHQPYRMRRTVIVLFLILLHAPAYAETVFQNPKNYDFKLLQGKPNADLFFLLPQASRKDKHFSLADGFVLCEFLTLQNTKLNICYIRKDISNRPILDIKRFFLEIKLDF